MAVRTSEMSLAPGLLAQAVEHYHEARRRNASEAVALSVAVFRLRALGVGAPELELRRLISDAVAGRLAGRVRSRARRSATVLVVEDEYAVAVGLVRLVRRWGAEAQMTASPEAAAALASRLRPQLALVDINLRGGFEGIELGRHMAARHGAGVVYVTGYPPETVRAKLPAADAAPVLSKPVRLPDLNAAFRAALAARGAQRA